MGSDLIDFICARYDEAVGTCPYDMHGYRAMDCENECRDTYSECWRRYFTSEYESFRTEAERMQKAVHDGD